MERGPSYLRQREVVAAGGSLVDVVDTLLEELETNEFTRRREPVDGPVPGPLPTPGCAVAPDGETLWVIDVFGRLIRRTAPG